MKVKLPNNSEVLSWRRKKEEGRRKKQGGRKKEEGKSVANIPGFKSLLGCWTPNQRFELVLKLMKG
jgi:hypothetical protein